MAVGRRDSPLYMRGNGTEMKMIAWIFHTCDMDVSYKSLLHPA